MATSSMGSHRWAKLVCVLSVLAVPVYAITRSAGEPNDPNMVPASRACGGMNQTMYTAAYCPALIRCVMDRLPSDITSGMSSGSNIASLIPTIAALIGAPPMELVQMGLFSPHRALATCCFSIGLPSGLFRQLRPLLPSLGDKLDRKPNMREWIWQLPMASSERWQYSWRNVLIRVMTDVIILGLAGVMLWYTWRINTETMVTWRCEYSVLLFLWPVACIGWLIVAMVLLMLMKQKMEIFLISPHSSQSTPLTIAQLMMIPYTLRPITGNNAIGGAPASNTGQGKDPKGSLLPVVQSVNKADGTENPDLCLRSANTWPQQADQNFDRHLFERRPESTVGAANDGIPKIVIQITMPDDFGLRSWRWYEAFLETIAVGIYLYATFVLTSSLFMSGDMALTYASIVTLCLSGLRILGSIF